MTENTENHSVPEITKQQFHRYLKVQYGSRFNMLMEWASAARTASLTKGQYARIQDNYDELLERHGDLN